MCSPVDLSASEFFYLQVLEPAQKIKLWQGPEKKHQFINTKKKPHLLLLVFAVQRKDFIETIHEKNTTLKWYIT